MGEGARLELAAVVYSNTYEARASANDLAKMHDAGAIEIVDVAVLVREVSGKLSITQRALTPKKGAKRGALIGAAFGVIFPPSLLASAAIGAAAGAVAGKADDTGFERDLLEQLGKKLDPGKSAVLAMVETEHLPDVLESVDGYEALVQRTLHADEAGRISLSGE